jgi:hypothetical protein
MLGVGNFIDDFRKEKLPCEFGSSLRLYLAAREAFAD